jgi:hypothetical protein
VTDLPARSEKARQDPDPEDAEFAEIKRDIERTRAELSETIDKIQARFTPERLVAQAKEAALGAGTNLVAETSAALTGATKGAVEDLVATAEEIVNDLNDTARDAGGSFVNTIRQNPLPAAMAGIGIGLLLARRHRGHTHQMRDNQSSRGWQYHDEYPAAGGRRVLQDPASGMPGPTGRAQDQNGGLLEDAADTVRDTMDNIKETVGEIASSAGDLAGDAGERAAHFATAAGSTAIDAGETFWSTVQRNPVPAAITGLGLAWMLLNRFNSSETRSDVRPSMAPAGDLADRARDQIEDLGTGAQFQARRAQKQLSHMMDDAPLAIGAAALGLGAAIGLAVPTTARERKLMGETREALMEKTQQVAQDAQERLLHVAEQVQQAVTEEIRDAERDLDQPQRRAS